MKIMIKHLNFYRKHNERHDGPNLPWQNPPPFKNPHSKRERRIRKTVLKRGFPQTVLGFATTEEGPETAGRKCVFGADERFLIAAVRMSWEKGLWGDLKHNK